MILISRVDPTEYDAPGGQEVAPEGSPGVAGEPASEPPAAAVGRIVSAATEADLASPFDEATWLRLRHRGLRGGGLWVASEGDGSVVGLALTDADPADASFASGPVEVNLVVAPTARARGAGRALAQRVLDAFDASSPGARTVSAWSHGNHPAAARLAHDLGFGRVRDLWVMRRPLSADHPLPEVTAPGGVDVRAFEVGRDEDAVVAVNAAAFADHPEQGTMTRADLAQRMAEPWFDPAGLLLATDEAGDLLGFHWTKAHPAADGSPAVGEVYVVGIAPQAQGRGLGRVLTLAGLHHLRDRGLGEVLLYVEADNAPAVAVYTRLGFTHAERDTHVMYRRRGRTDGAAS